MLLSPILLAVGAVMAAGLNSLGIFGAPAMAPNVYNLVIIAARDRPDAVLRHLVARDRRGPRCRWATS